MSGPETAITEWCRHENYEGVRCNEPAMVIVWGKLFNPWELGPRCVDHLPPSVQRARDLSQVAVLDLRGLHRVDSGSKEPRQ